MDPALPLRRARTRRGAIAHRVARKLSLLLIVAGVLVLAWAVLVWQWQDPFTALYTHFEQRHLAARYDRELRSFRPARPVPRAAKPNAAVYARAMAIDAAAYARTLSPGDPVGRLQIGRIGLHMVVVQGTDHDSLTKGPGHYIATGLPGEGRLIYIAGHRTTYLAPFADINDIRVGDYVRFSVPYGAFVYRVFRHYIVPADDLAVLRNHGREILRLQACHPRFFATHRYIVDARLVAFEPRGLTTWLRAS